MKRPLAILPLFLLFGAAHAQSAAGGDDAAKLAEKLSNPVASLISVPLQFNYDSSIGPARDGHKNYVNIQPVVPIQLNEAWNVISRTILPVVSQADIAPGSGSQHGIGDITQSFFFTPRAVGSSGVIWGLGPALLIPTASDALLGGKTWGTGPTGLVLRQAHGWTWGVLVNQIWSVASVKGKYSDRPPVSAVFVQPFLSFTTPTAWTYGTNLESSYDWHGHDATVPVNFSAAKLTRFGKQPVSFTGGIRYWIASTDTGPHGWGYRFVVTMLFPK